MLVERLDAVAGFFLLQLRAGEAVGVGDLDAHLRVGGVALFGPEGAEEGVGEAGRVEVALLGGDDHPAGWLVPAGRQAVFGVVLRLKDERHAEVLAPAVELERVVGAARLRSGAKGNAAGARHDVLEVEGLEDELGAVLAHDVVEARPAEVGPGRGQAVVAGDFDHRIAILMASNLDALAALARRSRGRFVEPVAPIARFAARVRDGEDQDIPFVERVNEAVGEAAQAATADFIAHGVPCLGEPADPVDGGEGFEQERVAEPRRFAVVARYGFVQLLLRDLEEPDGHATRYFASTS